MTKSTKRALASECINKQNETVTVKGWVKRIRHLGNVSFLVLREHSGEIQCVLENVLAGMKIEIESVVSVTGKIVKTTQTKSGVELLAEKVEILNASLTPPFELNKKEVNASLEHILNHRTLSLRHEKLHAIFSIKATLAHAFGEYLNSEKFTRIFTPKIVSQGAEGGANVFTLNYFGKEAYLAQSPQFYKQMMVASGYERVYEVGSVYRAEEHNSSRHLNEYISLDVEVGFIESFYELMELETNVLRYMMKTVKEKHEKELNLLQVEVPTINEIPSMTVLEAQEILMKKYKKEMPEGDLNAEGEKLIAKYIKETTGSEFVFITNYPKESRPMYTMPNSEGTTNSFDLLYKGIEITSGGERIHEHEMLLQSFKEKGLNPENFEQYLQTFQYGMPPHGGFAIGLERVVAKLLNLSNVREASAFPRDCERILP